MYRWHLFPFNPFWLAHVPTNRQNFSFPQHVAIDSAVSNARDVADENRNAFFFDAFVDPVESAISIVFPIDDDDDDENDDDDDDDALVERAVPDDAPKATTPKTTTETTTANDANNTVEKKRRQPPPPPRGSSTTIIIAVLLFSRQRQKQPMGEEEKMKRWQKNKKYERALRGKK
tara:strand:+ start:6134 stop:6658 length:525 start_codon:yes stop_codon:yes gene_type:complete